MTQPASPDPTPVPKKRSGTLLRMITVAPLVPAILWLMFLGPHWAFRIFVFLAIAIAELELMSMVLPGAENRWLRIWGVLAAVGLAASMAFCPYPLALPGALFMLIVGALFWGLVRPLPIEKAGAQSAWLIAGPIYVGVTIVALDPLHALPEGGAWVLFSMCVAWFSDTFAYFSGRYFGRHTLHAQISPQKTWEGALGGLCGSALAAVMAHFWLLSGLPLIEGIALALIAGALGQAGDLLESLIKRSAGVKDSSGLLPGHGGILDRADALMFVAPVIYAYAALFRG